MKTNTGQVTARIQALANLNWDQLHSTALELN